MITGKSKRLSKKSIVFVSTLVVFAAAVTTIFALIYQKGYYATSMRLLRVEGTVNIETANGGTKPVIDNIRFQSGDALNTGADGLASVGLDDTKIITLQSDSRAEFTKQGKHLELKLTKGAVFFNVTEKLQPDETFEIKTSTMTAGIRGTSGYVYYDDSGRDALIITDGAVEVKATNPDTGETKTAKVEGGESITVYLYSDREEDTVQFTLEEVGIEDLNDFTVQMIANNDELLNRVCDYTGWDKEALKDVINSIPSTTPTPTATPAPSGTQTPTPTQTVTPTPNPTDTPTPAPTAGSTSTPTPKPTNKPTATPTTKPTATPTTKPTATPTTKPTATPTTKPTATPTTKPTATPTTKPTATPTTKPTATPTTKPTATPTTKPTATPTTKPTATPTNVPEPSNIPEPTPVPNPETSIPEGYSKVTDAYNRTNDTYSFVVWGVEYDGHEVYLCKAGDYPYFYKGWYDYEWVDLTVERGNDYTINNNLVHDETYKLPDGSVYYDTTVGSIVRVIVFIDPDLPDDYEKVDNAWDVQYDGRTVYMGYKKSDNLNAGWDYIGYYNDQWVNLRSDDIDLAIAHGRCNFYVSGTDTVYYSYVMESPPNPETSVPDGWTKLTTSSSWGAEYNGISVYIIYQGGYEYDSNDRSYKGWYNDQWVDLTVKNEGMFMYSKYVYRLSGTDTIYYSFVSAD